MARLFQQGFFGKGTLSRSEATWKQRNAKDAQGISLEDITRQRRMERAQQKKEKLKAIVSPSSTSTATNLSSGLADSSLVPDSAATSTVSSPILPASNAETTTLTITTPTTPPQRSSLVYSATSSMDNDQQNCEHLQLSLEEGFFLVFAIEVLAIVDNITIANDDASGKIMTIQECWQKFAQASIAKSALGFKIDHTPFHLEPDNPFIVRYVAYHYFRSQGWVVKDGLKYGTDFMLYSKGMVFGHSQYGVRVLACKDTSSIMEKSQYYDGSFSNMSFKSFMSPTPGSSMIHAAYSWQWLLSLNRIISQVQKTTLICHVVVPKKISAHQLSHPRTALPMYSIVEIGIKRFLPERNRA
ncbi:tRNA splicing endonuclease subunit sen2 [Podila epigama]|nr:tRNA splicing endonuclease subunit sen2 [Podila epigama]